MSVLVVLKDIVPQYKSEDFNAYMLIIGGRIKSNNVMMMNSKLTTALAGASDHPFGASHWLLGPAKISQKQIRSSRRSFRFMC